MISILSALVALLSFRVRSRASPELELIAPPLKQNGNKAVIIVAGALTYTNGKRIADLALRSGLPSMHGLRDTIVARGLAALGPDLVEIIRQAARQIDKIIKGERPADIPVEQLTRYAICINLKTVGRRGEYHLAYGVDRRAGQDPSFAGHLRASQRRISNGKPRRHRGQRQGRDADLVSNRMQVAGRGRVLIGHYRNSGRC